MAKKRNNPFRFWVILAVIILVAALLSLGVNFWVYKEIQRRLKIKVDGQYIPLIYKPAFQLKNANFNWEDKVRLVDGNMQVQFDLIPLLERRGIRIVLKSEGAKIKFLGNWAIQEGIEDATVDMLYADVILGRRGISGINTIEAKSPSFQFSLKNAEKKG